MPKRPHRVLSRISNFTKAVIERLSPRKKQKVYDKENASIASASSASIFSVNPRPHNVSDVFLSSQPSDLPQTGFFYHTGVPVPPSEAHTQFYHEFSLPPPPRRHDEAPDEDDISIMTHNSDISLDEDDPEAELRAEMERETREHQPDPEPPNVVPQVHAESPLPDGKLREAPTVAAALAALQDLKELLHPHRKTGRGYKLSAIDPFVRVQMENMETMLNLYTGNLSKTKGFWVGSSLQAAVSRGRGTYCARQLRILVRQFIADRTVLPINPYGYWNTSMLVDENLQEDINLYLQELGKEITAEKLVEYLRRPDVMTKHGISRKISLKTAQRYLKELGYRWMSEKKGQYADGHERPDVVDYRQNKFLPAWDKIKARMETWLKENLPEFGPQAEGKPVVVWFHDESIFYAHDRRRKTWYHKDAPAKPYAKGEGASLMIADFVSSKYGWLRSLDGKRDARVIMSPGKHKDGYFTNVEIRAQAQKAMDLLNEFYPDEEHIFIYDNATTHLKRPEGSLSTTKMPKGPSSKFFVEVNLPDKNGAQVYSSTGAYVKQKIPMADTTFQGRPQPLYFPAGHALAGQFKGMTEILAERGIDTTGKLAQCTGFKCAPPALNCCCRRILYNQLDFEYVKSSLELDCNERGFGLIFLPKFHCELNFIEQCWGYAKRLYCLNPESSREDALECNALAALDAIPLVSMRRFANRSTRFMSAYSKGLTGEQAAWAARKYPRHRVVPESLMDDMEEAGV